MVGKRKKSLSGELKGTLFRFLLLLKVVPKYNP